MTDPIFFYRAGQLWHRDTHEQRWEMLALAEQFERDVQAGLWPSWSREMAQQARTAIAQFDADPNHVEDISYAKQ